MKTCLRFGVWWLIIVGLCASGVSRAAPAPERGFARREFKVDGVTREALVYAPTAARTNAAPVVFVFHGHGGNAFNAVRSFRIHLEWPEAISVYMQGLNTPGRLTDPEGKKPGWQKTIGDQGDRDLKFFDAVLGWLQQEYRVDRRRIYATGHSNGGAFTYLLWAARGQVFAALAPSAAAGALRQGAKLEPKPVLHVAGEKDPLVKFEWQRMCMAEIRHLNGCVSEGKPWAENCTVYEAAAKGGAPVVTCIHPGGHGFYAGAPPLIVKFFKEHPAASAAE